MYAMAAPILGSIGSGLVSGLFGKKNDPAKQAQQYLSQIPGTIKPYLEPYVGAGRTALDTLMSQYQGLIGDPASMMNKMGQGYQQSPGYQFQLGEGQRAMNQGAAAGGMLGTPQEQAELARYSQGLASQDYGNYLNQILGMYGQGLQGMGGINQMGYGASTNLAQMLKDALESQASLGYAGAASKQMGGSNMMGGIAGLMKYLQPLMSGGAGANMLGGVGSTFGG